jgi:hypothetical protein
MPIMQRIHGVALRKMQNLRTTVPMRKLRFYWTLGTFSGFFSLMLPKQLVVLMATNVLETCLN